MVQVPEDPDSILGHPSGMKKNVSCLLRFLYSIISLFFWVKKPTMEHNGTNMPQPNFAVSIGLWM